MATISKHKYRYGNFTLIVDAFSSIELALHSRSEAKATKVEMLFGL
jgi:hypothetical protein